MHWHSVQTSYRYRLFSNIPTYLQFHWEIRNHTFMPFQSFWSSVPFVSLLCGLLYPDLLGIIGLIFTSKTTRNKQCRIFGGWTENCLATWNSWVLLVWICAQKLNPTFCCCRWRTIEDLIMNLSCSGYFVSRKELSIPWSHGLELSSPSHLLSFFSGLENNFLLKCNKLIKRALEILVCECLTG